MDAAEQILEQLAKIQANMGTLTTKVNAVETKFEDIDTDGNNQISQKEWIAYAKETKSEDKQITRNTQIASIISKLIDVAFLVLLVLSTFKNLPS